MYNGYGNALKTEDLQEFLKQFNYMVNEIGVSETEARVNSHTFNAGIRIDCLNTNKSYKIVGTRLGYLGGCGCPADIVIEIEEEND